MYILRCGIRISFFSAHPVCARPLGSCGNLGGQEGLGASGQPPRTSQGDEVKIHLRQYTLSDPCFRLGNLDRNRHRSIGRAFDCFEESELWMEYSSQSEDRWENSLQRRAE